MKMVQIFSERASLLNGLVLIKPFPYRTGPAEGSGAFVTLKPTKVRKYAVKIPLNLASQADPGLSAFLVLLG